MHQKQGQRKKDYKKYDVTVFEPFTTHLLNAIQKPTGGAVDKDRTKRIIDSKVHDRPRLQGSAEPDGPPRFNLLL